MSKEGRILNRQIIGNIGLYYVCYQLSLRGWNVMPTARNAKGPDVLIYNEDATRKRTIQVKTVSGNTNVRLGNSADVFGDFVVICRQPTRNTPISFVLTAKEVHRLARHSKKKESKVLFWIEPRDYDTDEFREKWKRIGSGLIPLLSLLPPPPKRVDLRRPAT